jgi:hypothetical protein
VGFGAWLFRELAGEMSRYINTFSTPARLVLDELFGADPARERPLFLAFLTIAFTSLSLSQKA